MKYLFLVAISLFLGLSPVNAANIQTENGLIKESSVKSYLAHKLEVEESDIQNFSLKGGLTSLSISRVFLTAMGQEEIHYNLRFNLRGYAKYRINCTFMYAELAPNEHIQSHTKGIVNIECPTIFAGKQSSFAVAAEELFGNI